jgi:hypothetical protein
MAGKPSALSPSLCLSLVLALAIIACIGSLGGEFVSDDNAFLVDNPKLHSLKQIPSFFSQGMWEFSKLDVADESLYRPVPLSLWCVMKTLGARSPLPFHLLNILLHLLNTALLWMLLARFFPRQDHIALVGAGLFAVHPVHVEPICWISAMSHLLGTSFFLGSLLAVVHGVRADVSMQKNSPTDRRRTLFFVALASVLSLLGMLSQEMCIGIVGIVLVYGVVTRQRRVTPFVVGAVLVASVYVVLRVRALGTAAPDINANAETTRQLIAYGTGYLKYLVVPWPQALFLKGPGAAFFGGFDTLCAILIIVGLIALISPQRGPRWCLLLAAAWLVFTLLPPVAAALHPFARFAIRSLYLPSVGLCIAVSAGLASRWTIPTKPSLAIALAIGIGLAGASAWGSSWWKSEEALFSRAVSTHPTGGDAQMGLAEIFLKRGDRGAARRSAEQASTLGSGAVRAEADDMLGMLYGESGEFDKSAEAYQRVLEIEPTRSSAWMGLGNIAWLRDDLTEAQRFYRVALEHDNQNYEALVNLGNVCEALGEKQEAYRYRELARPLGPDAQVSPAKEEKF